MDLIDVQNTATCQHYLLTHRCPYDFTQKKKTAGPIQSLITLPQNVKMKSRNTSRKLADKQMHDRSTAY